jgi:hypothetical protein
MPDLFAYLVSRGRIRSLNDYPTHPLMPDLVYWYCVRCHQTFLRTGETDGPTVLTAYRRHIRDRDTGLFRHPSMIDRLVRWTVHA